jgi:hypothetical protein
MGGWFGGSGEEGEGEAGGTCNKKRERRSVYIG